MWPVIIEGKRVSPLHTELSGMIRFLVCWSMLSFARAGGQTDTQRKQQMESNTAERRRALLSIIVLVDFVVVVVVGIVVWVVAFVLLSSSLSSRCRRSRCLRCRCRSLSSCVTPLWTGCRRSLGHGSVNCFCRLCRRRRSFVRGRRQVPQCRLDGNQQGCSS